MTPSIIPHPLAPSSPTARVARRLRVVFGALASAFVVMLVMPAPAYAHAHLSSSQPRAKAVLAAAPRALTLTFSEAPELAVSSLRLVDAHGIQVALGTLAHGADHHVITADITGPLAAGRYTVFWQVAGADGHVQRGSYEFTIAEGAAGLQPVVAPESAVVTPAAVPGLAAAPTDSVALAQPNLFDASSPAYVAIRFVQFAGLLLLIGAVAFRWWVLPRVGVELAEPARRDLAFGAAGAGLWGGWLLALSALARLVAQSLMTHGAGAMLRPSSLGSLLVATTWGHAWLLEVVGLVIVLTGLRQARRQVTSLMAWRLAAAGTLALAFVPALSGHAVASESLAPLAVLTDALHVLSAGAWLGTLAVMLVVGMRVVVREASGGRVAALAAMVNGFSPLAITCASLLVATGVFAAWLHLGSLPVLWRSSYGLVLFRKLVVVAMLLAVGTYNWKRVKPSLREAGADGARRLTRSGSIELGLALVVLLMTAVLVASPTPMEVLRP
jgi:putative copper export protein/methionine-rich copper-binding protein CopC